MGMKGQNHDDKNKLLPPTDQHGEDVFYKNADLRKALIIIERYLNV